MPVSRQPTGDEVRDAARRIAQRSRREQGLPAAVDDPKTLLKLYRMTTPDWDRERRRRARQ